MREFHKRETEQEATGTLYCLELPQEDDNEDTYCIDSGFCGNHARFVNHSVSQLLEKCHRQYFLPKIKLKALLS